MVKIISSIIVSVFCAFAYRFGGYSKEEGKKKFPWVPVWMFRSWIRDFFCSLIPLFWLKLFYPQVHPSAYGVTCALSYFALTTYWDKLFGFDNYWFHGFMVGLTYFLFATFSGLWLGFIVRCIAMAVLMGGISAITGDVDIEEFSRGAAIGFTLPLLLL